MGKVAVVINPSSKSGQNRRLRKELTDALELYFPKSFTLYETSSPGQASKIIREIIQHGVTLIIAAGGDGTIHQVANGILKYSETQCRLGIINLGSGGDLARTLMLPKRIIDQVKLISSTTPKLIDVGKLTCLDQDGNSIVRFYVNECQIGISANIVKHVSYALKKRWGSLSFRMVSVAQLFTYRSSIFTVAINESETIMTKGLGIVASNGRYCGGGMQLTPNAKIEDGWIDFVLIKNMRIVRRLYYFSSVLANRTVKSNKIVRAQIQSLHIQSELPALVEADGELIGQTPAHITVIPKALSLIY